MIEIIKQGQKPPRYRGECECGCVFICDKEDIRSKLQPNGRDYHQYVECPSCHERAISYDKLERIEG